MSKNSNLSAIILAGVVIGAAAWYLFGTEEGKKTTDSLAESLKDFSDSMMEKAHSTVSDIKEKMSNA